MRCALIVLTLRWHGLPARENMANDGGQWALSWKLWPQKNKKMFSNRILPRCHRKANYLQTKFTGSSRSVKCSLETKIFTDFWRIPLPLLQFNPSPARLVHGPTHGAPCGGRFGISVFRPFRKCSLPALLPLRQCCCTCC